MPSLLNGTGASFRSRTVHEDEFHDLQPKSRTVPSNAWQVLGIVKQRAGWRSHRGLHWFRVQELWICHPAWQAEPQGPQDFAERS